MDTNSYKKYEEYRLTLILLNNSLIDKLLDITLHLKQKENPMFIYTSTECASKHRLVLVQIRNANDFTR